MTVKAYGAHAADKPLEPMAIARRAPGARDVQIEIAYCGVCHSDLHTVRSVPEHAHPSPNVGNLIFKRRAIAGSLIGGLPETQEMLDFCAQHGIVADIEMIAAQDIDKAYDRMVRSDVKYRFVIDGGTF
jgi:D-arabinose 1-dehydrogenase-like Zn-dependent alcohol dehydrogenase